MNFITRVTTDLDTLNCVQTELWEGGLLVWHIKYQHLDPDKLEEDINLANNTKSSRLRHRLDIKKDDVQIVLPISKVIISLYSAFTLDRIYWTLGENGSHFLMNKCFHLSSPDQVSGSWAGH